MPKSKDYDGKYFTLSEVATRFALSNNIGSARQVIYRLVKEKKLGFVNISAGGKRKRYRFSEKNIQDFIEKYGATSQNFDTI